MSLIGLDFFNLIIFLWCSSAIILDLICLFFTFMFVNIFCNFFYLFFVLTFLGFNSPERAPLLSSTLVSPSTVPTENIGSFYTPIDSPENSDEETQTMSRKGEDSFLSDVMAKKLTEEQVGAITDLFPLDQT